MSLLSSVNSLMTMEGKARSKRFPTFTALIRLFSCMNPPVFNYIRFSFKELSTFRAFITHLSSVNCLLLSKHFTLIISHNPHPSNPSNPSLNVISSEKPSLIQVDLSSPLFPSFPTISSWFFFFPSGQLPIHLLVCCCLPRWSKSFVGGDCVSSAHCSISTES